MASKTEPTKGTKPKTTTTPKAGASSKTTSAKTTKVQAEASTPDDATKAPTTPDTAAGQAHVSDATADTESAARAADVDEVSTSTHRKEFVHGPGVYTEAGGFSHEANIAATRQGIINAGLRPVTDVKHVSTKTHEDGISKVLAYEAEVIPAHLAVVKDSDPEAEARDDAIVVSYEVAHPEVIQNGESAPATNPDKA
jgi:hypothetical protein